MLVERGPAQPPSALSRRIADRGGRRSARTSATCSPPPIAATTPTSSACSRTRATGPATAWPRLGGAAARDLDLRRRRPGAGRGRSGDERRPIRRCRSRVNFARRGIDLDGPVTRRKLQPAYHCRDRGLAANAAACDGGAAAGVRRIVFDDQEVRLARTLLTGGGDRHARDAFEPVADQAVWTGICGFDPQQGRSHQRSVSNNFLMQQIQDPDARLARIYAFAYEGDPLFSSEAIRLFGSQARAAGHRAKPI